MALVRRYKSLYASSFEETDLEEEVSSIKNSLPSPSIEYPESPFSFESSSCETSRLTKDERLAREEGIDKFITVQEIINMELKELKEFLLSKVTVSGMSQHQYDVCMAIRKRGKNKQAAQHCRFKKQKEIASLTDKVESRSSSLRREEIHLKQLIKIKADWERKLQLLCSSLLFSHNKDPNDWRVIVEAEDIRFCPTQAVKRSPV